MTQSSLMLALLLPTSRLVCGGDPCENAMNYIDVHCTKNGGHDLARICPCVDDPAGLVAQHFKETQDSCKNVKRHGMKDDWSCGHFDPDYFGKAVHVWQLCPKHCNKCAHNPCSAHFMRAQDAPCSVGREDGVNDIRMRISELKRLCEDRAGTAAKYDYN